MAADANGPPKRAAADTTHDHAPDQGSEVTSNVTGFAGMRPRHGEAPDGWRDLWQRQHAAAIARSAERRTRVLAHPDLAARLTRLPLGYTRADQWTGYVPPRVWGGSLNVDPRRQALAAICADALARDSGDCPALDVT